MEFLINVHHWAAGRYAGLYLMLLIGVSLCGCTQTLRVEQAEQGEQVNIDAFLHEHLQKQPMVTVAEAYRAMLILADGDDEYKDFAARQAALEERSIIRPQWQLQKEACIDRGTVAYMVYQILNLRGGINFELLGRWGFGDRRYALRELVYRDLMNQGPVYGYMTGSELVETLAKADEYMAQHGVYEEKAIEIADELESQAVVDSK